MWRFWLAGVGEWIFFWLAGDWWVDIVLEGWARVEMVNIL